LNDVAFAKGESMYWHTRAWEGPLLALADEARPPAAADIIVKDEILLRKAHAYVDAFTAHDSRSFHFASGLLPHAKRKAVRALYAFCRLTDDIVWTVFGAFRLAGKEAYDRAIDGAPTFIDPPELEVVRMVEQGDVVMAELTGTAKRAAGGEMRMSMAEVFVMRDGKIAERRAWVIELRENDFR
jgi:ketosteroid isomerase-like protein